MTQKQVALGIGEHDEILVRLVGPRIPANSQSEETVNLGVDRSCRDQGGAGSAERFPCPVLLGSPKSSDLVRRDRPAEPLQFEAPDGLGEDRLLDGREDPWADQGLAPCSVGAEP